MILIPLIHTLFPYTTLFRSDEVRVLHLERERVAAVGVDRHTGLGGHVRGHPVANPWEQVIDGDVGAAARVEREPAAVHVLRSEEHTYELQSRRDLVCRLQLE